MTTASAKHSIQKNETHGSVWSYTIGFVLSLLFTFAPYLIVVNKMMTGWELVAVLLVFAFAQLLVQLLFFLHMGSESRPRWHLVTFMLMVFFLAIVVIGSLWIMHNLDYNMMPHQMDEYMLEEEGIYRE